MEVIFGVAKIRKYAVSVSGDTLEMVERPHGGLSIVLVDGQRSGKSAKKISNVVARKAVQLLAEGVRDGVVARAAHDYLFNYRDGKVSATLNIISVDAHSQTVVVSRNNASPVIVHTPQRGVYLLDEPSQSIGTHRNVKPCVSEIPMELGPTIIAYTDGLCHAGSRYGGAGFDPVAATKSLLAQGVANPQMIADALLAQALAADDGRPIDDISVVVVEVREERDDGDGVRRVSGRLVL
jgi:serine phosphatase RsbU (regulator of sigma subunit)